MFETKGVARVWNYCGFPGLTVCEHVMPSAVLFQNKDSTHTLPKKSSARMSTDLMTKYSKLPKVMDDSVLISVASYVHVLLGSVLISSPHRLSCTSTWMVLVV